MSSSFADFRFACVVWGPSFVRGFLEVCLSSMLTPGNIPHLAERTRCRFRIYTTANDIDSIQGSSPYRRLADLMPVEFRVISGMNRVGRYRALTECHADFIRSARDDESALVFVSPDVVWADGAAVRLHEILENGRRMVALLTPRVVKETFVPELLASYRTDGEFAPIPPRELVKLSASHLHPEMTAAVWRGRAEGGSFTSGAYWMADGGYLARQFHLMPLAVVPQNRDAVPAVSVDADYCLASCPNPSDIYVVEDSDDLCLVDFTSRASAQPGPLTATPVEDMVTWARVHADSHHLEFAKHVLRYHWSDPPLGWEAIECESNELINAVLAQLQGPDQAAALARPSRIRYFSPRFIGRKVREEGVGAVARGIWLRVYRGSQRKLFGSALRIKLLSNPTIGKTPGVVRRR